MARITVEDCLKKVNNRFALIHMVSKRVRQLRKGAEPTITSKNRDIVISLREIAAGNIKGVGGGDHGNLLENQKVSPNERIASENDNDEEKTEEQENPKGSS